MRQRTWWTEGDPHSVGYTGVSLYPGQFHCGTTHDPVLDKPAQGREKQAKHIRASSAYMRCDPIHQAPRQAVMRSDSEPRRASRREYCLLQGGSVRKWYVRSGGEELHAQQCPGAVHRVVHLELEMLLQAGQQQAPWTRCLGQKHRITPGSKDSTRTHDVIIAMVKNTGDEQGRAIDSCPCETSGTRSTYN
jgi:hypothetical protein